MSTIKHTPFPWKIYQTAKDIYIEHDHKDHADSIEFPFVCDLQADAPELNNEAYENALANAKLIVNVPQMVEICKDLSELYHDSYLQEKLPTFIFDVIIKARNVLVEMGVE